VCGLLDGAAVEVSAAAAAARTHRCPKKNIFEALDECEIMPINWRWPAASPYTMAEHTMAELTSMSIGIHESQLSCEILSSIVSESVFIWLKASSHWCTLIGISERGAATPCSLNMQNFQNPRYVSRREQQIYDPFLGRHSCKKELTNGEISGMHHISLRNARDFKQVWVLMYFLIYKSAVVLTFEEIR
jgi:hypothetical protein